MNELAKMQLADLDWLSQAIEFSIQKIRQNIADLNSFPERTEDSKWVCVDNGGWVGGHWVGLLWLAFAHTCEATFKLAAYDWAARLAPRQKDATTHDLGFLFELSHVLGFHLTGDKALKSPAINAAQTLYRRFNERGNFFQAWGLPDASPELRGRTIIDTMMNLDLLFWASQETGDPVFSRCALAHAQTCQAHHVRSDYSTAHVVDFDLESGESIKQDTHQGLSPTSCWSRGQSWAIYGFGDCFQQTREDAFLQTARSLADYALHRLPQDQVPYWDYDSPLIPNDVRDSSAAAILAAGLLNLAELEEDATKTHFWCEHAIRILHSLWNNYTSQGTSEPCILLHGTRSKPHGLVDQGLIYGDYYFLEALLRLQAPNLQVT